VFGTGNFLSRAEGIEGYAHGRSIAQV
jgi:hypothetical protein